MILQDIAKQYGRSPQANALFDLLKKKSVHSLFLQGLVCSSASMFFGSLQNRLKRTVLFVLDDAEEAGYFYHDLTQILGIDNVLFYPSSYRRAVKYGQRDSANEILRTEALSRLAAVEGKGKVEIDGHGGRSFPKGGRMGGGVPLETAWTKYSAAGVKNRSQLPREL